MGVELTWRLLFAGHRVTLLNRGTATASSGDPFGDRVVRLRADRTTDAFDAALAGRRFDAVVDLAGFTGADASRAARVLDGRVGHYVFVSTGQVYLVREGCPRPAREADYDGPVMAQPPTPADHPDWSYGIEKRAAEDVLAAAGRDRGFPVTRLRIPMVNGERDPQRRIEGYLWRMLDGGPLLVPGGGAAIARHVYAGAVVAAILRVLGDRATVGEVYNLAQAETPTVVELLGRIGGLVGVQPRLVAIDDAAFEAAGLERRAVSPYSSRWMSLIDPARARTELGFRHPSLDDYLGRIVASFLAHTTGAPPPGYARRADELALAERAGTPVA